jgi:hypothetical protein
MKRNWISTLCLATCVAATMTGNAQTSVEALRARFLNPPAEARPLVRWWWFGPAVTKTEITRELEQMKADGIGGAELAFVYPVELDDPARGRKNLPFLSQPMLDAVHHAETEGKRLGLRIDVTLCSGWPYGGPHIPLALAAGRMRQVEVAVPPGATEIAVPAPREEGDTPLSAALVEGTPKAWTTTKLTPLAFTAATPARLTVEPSQSPRVALFYFAGHTRQQVKRAAVGAEGYVLDSMSHDAVATHLKAVGEPLVNAFGTTPPYAIFSDSLEAYGSDWTPALPVEFRKRRGYDLLPHLAEIFAGDTPAAERVRHDYGRTLTELVDENYLTQINDWAKAHGTKFRSQTYGEPAVNFSSQRLAALPEGEGSQWREFSTLRWASSANHVFGNTITSGETFTWLHSPVFRATPLDMKAETDVDFIEGENELIFHGWPYSPEANELPKGDPGWSLYAAGAFNDHNPWHPVMPAVTKYIARVGDLLRQGAPANQVAILLPEDDAWAHIVPGKASLTAALKTMITPELMDAILSAGYNVDFIDAAAIRTNGLGKHTIVVLPPTGRIPVDTIASLKTFTAQRGHVISLSKAPSLNPEGEPLPTNAWSSTGAVQVSAVSGLADALHKAAQPDLHADALSPSDMRNLGFIRRQLPGADVYFVTNTGNRPLKTTLAFGTQFAHGERWNTDTGLVMAAATASAQEIQLAPYESAVFVFSAKPAQPPAVARTGSAPTHIDLSSNWQVSFPAINKSTSETKLTGWTSDPSTKQFSGKAIYTRDFTLEAAPQGKLLLVIQGGTPVAGKPDIFASETRPVTADGLPNPLVTRTGPGMRAWFDPPIREAALVTVNGKPAGALWHPPYAIDISGLVHAGKNHIEITVFNTALNAWTAAPPRDYSKLIAVYGDRFQMQDLDKVAALPSGILGDILLTSEAPK